MKLKNISIKHKLMLINLVTIGIAVALIAIAAIVVQSQTLRQSLLHDLNIQAEIIASSSTASLAFNDQKSAAEALAALKASPAIEYAVIYTPDGAVFSEYRRGGTGARTFQPAMGKEATLVSKERMGVAHPIELHGEISGMVFIESSLEQINSVIARQALLVMIVLLSVFSVVFLLLNKLQKRITSPLLELTWLMRQASQDKSYSVRARFSGEDEIGMLALGFNDMLAQIQARDAALAQHRANLEQIVAQRTARLTEAQRIAHLGNWEWDIVSNTLAWSDEIYRIFGLDPHQFGATYDAFLNAVHPDDRQFVDDNVQKALKRQQPYSIDHRIVLPDGTVRHVHEQAEIVCGESDQILAMVGTVQDITERKNAEKELRDSKEILERMFEATHFSTVLLDLEFNFIRVNKTYADACGFAPGYFIGKNHFALYPSEELESRFKHVVETGIPYIVDSRPFEWPDRPELGTTYWDLAVYPLKGVSGNVEGLLFTLVEVTKRRLAEEKLRSSNLLLDSIVNYIPNMIFLKRASDLRFVLFNRAGEKLIGRSQNELLNHNDYDFFPKEQADFFTAKDREVLGQDNVVDIPEEPIETPNGIRFLHTRKLALRDENGQPQYLLGISEDVTERKQVEEKLRTLYAAIEQTPASVVITDLDANIQYVNPQFTLSTGYSPEEAIGRNPRILQSGKTTREIYHELWGNLTRGEPWHGELLNKHKNGGLYWEDVYISPVKNPAGTPVCYVAVKVDITERKRVEEERMHAEARFRTLFNSTGDMVVVHPLAGEGGGIGRFIEVNDVACERMGYSREEFFAMTPLDLDEPGICPSQEDIEAFQRRAREAGHIVFERVYVTKDGQRIPVEVSSHVFELHGTEMMLSVVRDITERKQYIDGLRKAQELAEEIAAAKSNFLANMSHEIRTPMNAIIGLTQLALNKQIPSEVRGYMEKVLDSSGSLLEILNDILDLSKIEAGRIVIEQTLFNLDAVLENIDSLFAVRAENKFLDFSIEVSSDVPRSLIGDALRLQQVLSNLVGNAIKFTEHGKVAVRIVLKEASKEKATLRFSVEDTGIGIAKENMGKLFQPFSQVDGSITRRFGGTGLGLAISSDLLKMMGSSFSVESMLGKGTTFSFELTLGVALSTAPVQVERRKRKREAGALSSGLRNQGLLLSGARILVVEDDAVNQQVVREFLELAGVTVAMASNGKEALEQLDQALFDAVLMDVHMPVMNGIDATKNIRMQPRFARLPIIALTADVSSDSSGNYLSSGMDAFVAKPIDPEKLITMLLHWVRHRRESAAGIHAAPAVTESPGGQAPAGESDMDLGNLPGFDIGNILKMVSGNRSKVEELLLSFRESSADVPAGIEAKMKAGDFPAARELAHKLKGTAGNLGAQNLHAATARLERELKSGQCDPATFAAFLDEFNGAMSVISELRQPEDKLSAPASCRETLMNAALEIDMLLKENGYISDEPLNQLKANLPAGKLGQFAVLHRHVRELQYTQARQVLRTLAELPDVKGS